MKHLPTLVRATKILISAAGALMLLGWIIAPTVWTKPHSYLATIVLPYAPDFFKFLRLEFSLPLTLAYELFLLVSLILGIDFDWYSEMLIMANRDSYYDKVIHFASGILVAAVGQELFALYLRQSNQNATPLWFQALFIFGITAIVTVGWECFEFLYDQLFDGHMQELVKSGVADTMWDMISSLIGGTLYLIALLELEPLISQKSRKK